MDLSFWLAVLLGVGLRLGQISVTDGSLHTCEDADNGVGSRTYKYDDLTELCCGGKVFENTRGEHACDYSSLHGQMVYLAREEFICKGRVLPYDGDLRCCNDAIIKSTTTLCCENIGHHNITSSDECCGAEVMDSSTSTCCHGNKVEGVGDCCGWGSVTRVYDSQIEMCVDDEVYQIPEDRGYSFCWGRNDRRGELYNEATHICCDGTVTGKNGRVCQDSVLFDPSTHVYLPDPSRVIPIENGKSKACGYTDETYNPNDSVCCSDGVHYVGSADGACCSGVVVRAYSKHNASCCRGSVNDVPEILGMQDCTGNQSFLSSAEISCSFGVADSRPDDGEVACCGKHEEPYYVSHKICCQGHIHTENTINDACCGSEVFDGRNQLCFSSFDDREVVEARNGEDSFCVQYNESFVVDRKIPYNSSKHVCMGGALAAWPTRLNVSYCPGPEEFYDPEDKICCQDRALYSRRNHWGLRRECCDWRMYHPDEESCIHDQVHPFPRENAGECGAHVFDDRTHVCINYAVFNKETTELTEEMCRRHYYLRAFGQACCRGEPIDESTHLCCNGNIRIKGDMQDPECCGDYSYDDATSELICCEERLHRTNGVTKVCDGRLAVTEDEQVCGHTVHKMRDGLCCGDGVFDSETHLCCDNVRIEKTHPNDLCCGTRIYREHANNEICCGSRTLHVRDHPNNKCCGTALFDPSQQMCLQGEYIMDIDSVFTCNLEVTDDRGTCCNGIMHVGRFGYCSGLEFRANATRRARADDGQSLDLELRVEDGQSADTDQRADDGQSLGTDPHADDDQSGDTQGVELPCGGGTYNPQTHSCCNEKPIKIGQKLCCGGRARKITDIRENDCCGSKAFNNQSSICCGREIRDKADIQSERDADGCCEEGWELDLTTMLCRESEGPEQETDCTLCSEEEPREAEITEKVCQTTHHMSVKIRGTSEDSSAIRVKVSSLSKKDSSQPAGALSRRDLKKLRKMVPPENCNCRRLSENGKKYILLSSGAVDGQSLVLQSGDLLLPCKDRAIVTEIIDSGVCHPPAE